MDLINWVFWLLKIEYDEHKQTIFCKQKYLLPNTHKYSTVRSPAVPQPHHQPLAAVESVRVNKLYNADTEADRDTQVCKLELAKNLHKVNSSREDHNRSLVMIVGAFSGHCGTSRRFVDSSSR